MDSDYQPTSEQDMSVSETYDSASVGAESQAGQSMREERALAGLWKKRRPYSRNDHFGTKGCVKSNEVGVRYTE